jgi:hypothetical protein
MLCGVEAGDATDVTWPFSHVRFPGARGPFATAPQGARLRLDVGTFTTGAHIDAGGTFTLLERALSLPWRDFDPGWMTATICGRTGNGHFWWRIAQTEHIALPIRFLVSLFHHHSSWMHCEHS